MGRDTDSMAAPKAPVAPGTEPVETQRDLLRGLHRLTLPMPKTGRELFQLLALYEPSEGLGALLDRVDVAGVQPHHVYRVVHNRAPESLETGLAPTDYDPRKHIEAALLSVEFQQHLLGNLLRAFPEKRREVFIHVPKSAGTDLILNLGLGRLSIPKTLEDPRWIGQAELFATLRAIARALPYYDSVFIFGHMVLGEYLKMVNASSGDRIFTVLREPFAGMLSQANYAVTRLRQDPAAAATDTREILEALQIPALPEQPSLAEMRALAMRALRCPEIVQPNSICVHLGNDGRPTFEAAVQNIIMYDVEVSTTAHYAAWLASRWGIRPQTRHNLSDHWLRHEDIDDETSELLWQRSGEDRRLFALVETAIRRSGTPSVGGGEIAATLGAADDQGDAAAARPGGWPVRHATRRDVIVAQGPSAIDAFLGDHGGAEPTVAFTFGVAGDLDRYEAAGWARPEPGFTWTAAPLARLALPKPVRPGDYRLRLTVAPYVVPGKVPRQRVVTAVNGIVLGELAIADRTIVEYELPAAVLGGDAMMRFAFTLPDAACPREVTGVQDERLLAVAFASIELFHCDDLRDPTQNVATEMPPHGGEARQVGAGAAAPSPAAEAAAPVAAAPDAPNAAAGWRELMMGFESLGQNCEFGLVQRRCGAEPLGLFRFASAPLPNLLAALDARFAGLADSDNLDVQLSETGREFMVEDRRFGLLYHAWVLADEMTPEQVGAREARRLPLLIRKLIEDLEQGDKIFVYHGMEPMTLDQASALSAMLGRYGNGTLLWVEPADREHAAGSVERLAPRLLKGYIDRFAPGDNAHDLSLGCWITICREAVRLRRAVAAEAEPAAARPV